MQVPAFNDRVEKKFQIGIEEKEVATLWRELSTVLRSYGLEPVQEVTSVGSVYFDNKDCDLLRFSLLGHLLLFRTRAYEMYGSPPRPISEYWVEVKTAQGSRRRKRRFPLTRRALYDFMDGKDLEGNPAEGAYKISDEYFGELYRAGQETVLTMGLQPILLVTCKRIAFQSDTSRLSIDWDVQYYHAPISVYEARLVEVSRRTFSGKSWKSHTGDEVFGR